MKTRQYVIGEFASMNKVSSRMLRHYDKIGLLCPIQVLPNGYRYYSEEQIDTISQIKRLRACGFLLDEISGILKNRSPDFLAEEAKRKLVDMQTQAALHQSSIQALSKLARENDSLVFPSIYGVSLSSRRESNMLMQKKQVTLNGVEDGFDTLYHLLEQKILHANGPALLLNRFDSMEERQYQVGVTIAENYIDKLYQTFRMPPVQVLSVIYYGDYYNIGHAYNALLYYGEQNAHSIDGLFMERYFIDSSHGAGPDEYVTEISVALKNTP